MASAMFRLCNRCSRYNAVSGRRYFSETNAALANRSYKMVIAGGGTGGSAMANRFAKKFGQGQIAVIEPSEKHYYQPMFTMVGGGIKRFEDTWRPTGSLLPKQCDWIKDRVTKIDPKSNSVTIQNGDQISYEYLVVALGLTLNFDKVKGLVDALKSDDRVCSNYSPIYVNKTFPAMQQFTEGNAIFTFPNTPIKCAGAPQKIMYLAEEYLRKTGKRDKATVMLNSSLGVLFGIKKYAESLWKVVKARDLKINLRRNLIEVKPGTSEAVFALLDSEKGETETYKYEMLHVTPPMSTPEVVSQSPLVDGAGYITVDRNTLQHTEYANVFALGDCTDVPTAKTAAAVAAQSGHLQQTIKAVLDGRNSPASYDGYTSCPLVTGRGKCILAEFDFDGQPLETFPIDQGKERRTMYHMKKDVMPHVYWHMLLTGVWDGPAIVRKLTHLGLSK